MKKIKLLLLALLIFLLAGCSSQALAAPEDDIEPPQQEQVSVPKLEKAPKADDKSQDSAGAEQIPKAEPKPEQGPADKPQTAPPSKPQAVPKPKLADTVTFSISCDTINSNLDMISEDKKELVPQDGVLLELSTVEIKADESVFEVLQRVVKDNKLHMEFVKTPAYNSAYIEGIGNLYEFDCGPLSGWMYRVNGEFPSFGCSLYKLKAGDAVEFVYTCDLGADVGGDYAAQNAEKQ